MSIKDFSPIPAFSVISDVTPRDRVTLSPISLIIFARSDKLTDMDETSASCTPAAVVIFSIPPEISLIFAVISSIEAES